MIRLDRYDLASRWYPAEVPNTSSNVPMYTEAAARAAGRSANRINITPAGKTAKNAQACIRPRHVGRSAVNTSKPIP